MIVTLLIMFAFVCFAFSAWQHASPYWNRTVAIGLAAVALAWLLGRTL